MYYRSLSNNDHNHQLKKSLIPTGLNVLSTLIKYSIQLKNMGWNYQCKNKLSFKKLTFAGVGFVAYSQTKRDISRDSVSDSRSNKFPTVPFPFAEINTYTI